jgi:hypothetical protein
MTTFKVTLSVLASVLFVTGSAHAAITTTTPFVAASTETIECGAVNAATVARTVRIQIVRSFDGLVLEDTGPTPVALAAGTAFGAVVFNEIDEVYCRFIANSSLIHGSLNVRSTSTGIDRLVLPAR